MNKTYERIEALCRERGITVTELCRQTGASRSALSDLKRGRSLFLSTKTMQLIAEYFGVSVADILDAETPGFIAQKPGKGMMLDYLHNDISRLAIRCGEDAPILIKASEIEAQKKRITVALRTFCRVDELDFNDLEGAERKRAALEMAADIVDVFLGLDEAGRRKLAERSQELRLLAKNKAKK